MIVPVTAISNLVLNQQIYSAETNGAHAHNRDRVPLSNRDDNRVCLGLSAGTVITKETKEPNNRVLMGALLFGCIVSFVIRIVICASVPTEGTVYMYPLYFSNVGRFHRVAFLRTLSMFKKRKENSSSYVRVPHKTLHA